MKIKKTTITELLIKWLPWIVAAFLVTLIFSKEPWEDYIRVLFLCFLLFHPLYIASIYAFHEKHTSVKGLLKIYLLSSPYILFLLFYFQEIWLLILWQYVTVTIWWFVFCLIRFLSERKSKKAEIQVKNTSSKEDKRKKIILLIFKIIPLPFILSVLFYLALLLLEAIGLSTLDFFPFVILLFLPTHPMYLSALNSFEKDYRFIRRLLEMALLLSPFLIPLIGGNGYDIGWAIWLLVCIYLYAAMIISWTIFYFIRKFYDKKYKAKAVEAE